MKNALLVLLMMLLPWQAITAAERNFDHVVDSQQGEAAFIKHYTEHVELIMHHHDGDGEEDSGVPHDDDSQQSARHLADFDHSCSFNVLFPAPLAVAAFPAVRIAPAICPVSLDDRTTAPPRRPPRALA